MIFDTDYCDGCRTCELVCSFHHKGAFCPSVSSIKILEADKQGFIVSLAEKREGQRLACDHCAALDEPLCLKYCCERDELKAILSTFWGSEEAAG